MPFALRLFPLAVVVALGCGRPVLPEPPANPEPLTLETEGGTRLHVVQTGWVSVKQRFRELEGPASLRIPSIIADRRWTEWLPIQFFVIEHSEGVIVFDTGEPAEVADPEYFDCNGGTKWFYTNQLRFAVNPGDELGPQLAKLGIDPASVRWTVLSHLHSDHIGGLKHLTGSTVLISRADAKGHRGALLCRIPPEIEPVLVDYDDNAFGAFERSHSITRRGDARIVPTPGHTPGHQSILLREDDKYYFIAGDVVFDLERLESGRALAGIVEDVEQAKESIERVRRQVHSFDTFLAPAHDRDVRGRHGHSH